MGATDFRQAAEGTIRREFATDIQCNVVHGSDAPETAAFEIGYFFNRFEIVSRMTSAVNLANVAVVLVQPNISENIGAAARAMCNMGLRRLIVVDPPRCDLARVCKMATGPALDVIEDMEVDRRPGRGAARVRLRRRDHRPARRPAPGDRQPRPPGGDDRADRSRKPGGHPVRARRTAG